MARASSNKNALQVSNAKRALDQFKYEVARDMHLAIPDDHYWGGIPSAQCGAVGGQMVRKMIEMAEQNLAGRNR